MEESFEAPGVHVHDGFYFRFASGFGVYTETLRSEETDLYGGDRVEGSGLGFATVGDLAMGGTVACGLVFGGGIFTADLVTGTFRTNTDSPANPPEELDPGLRSLVVAGPMIDWYFNPRKGLHFLGSLGWAWLSAADRAGAGSDDYYALGGGAVVGLGYDWWIGEQWSLGVMGRVMGVVVWGKDDDGTSWLHTAGTTQSALVNITYH